MSGHSKWANIKHKKDATDKKRGKIFSRLAKEIMVAAKMGGGDANANPRLRSALTAARAANMPNTNIDRAIKKGLGELGDVTFEEILYEGYAPGGVALLIECLTDNRNRSISEVRTTLDRSNGNLAAAGAVGWMFKRLSHFVISGDNADEDKLMDIVLDAGADDIDSGLLRMARSQRNCATELAAATLQRAGYLPDVDLYGLLHYLDETLIPAMRGYDYHVAVNPTELMLGLTGCHSAFLPLFQKVAREEGVSLLRLIADVSAIDRKSPSEALLRETAQKLK